MSLYEACSNIMTNEDGASNVFGRSEEADMSVLMCISQHVAASDKLRIEAAIDKNTWLTLISGALVFFMQAGFAMLCAGSVRRKNLQMTMLKNVLDVCGAAVAFWLVGYAFAFGGQDQSSEKTFIGKTNFLSIGEEIDYSFWFMQFAFSASAVTIVAGTIAERTQMTAYLLYSILLTGFVYPVVVHSIWSNNGFLSAATAEPLGGIGVIDFAGSGVVHLTGGVTALFAAILVGPRVGRFADAAGNQYYRPKKMPGSSVALQVMGTMVLWFGWYGFNPGSALLLGLDNAGSIAARAAVNTSLSAASGALAAMSLTSYLQFEKTQEINFSIGAVMNGALSGLVAITASCGTVELWAAFLIGSISGMIYVAGSHRLIAMRIDDVVDGIPIHFLNGAWGLLSVGLFSSPSATKAAYGTDLHVGWFYSLGRGSSDAVLLRNQVYAILFIMAWAFVTMFPFFLWLKRIGWLRVHDLEELVGMDRAYHGESLPEARLEVREDVSKYNSMKQRSVARQDNSSIMSHSNFNGTERGFDGTDRGLDHSSRSIRSNKVESAIVNLRDFSKKSALGPEPESSSEADEAENDKWELFEVSA